MTNTDNATAVSTPFSPANVGSSSTGSSNTGAASGISSLRRSDDRMIAGVCAGVAQALGLDINLVRLITLISTLFVGTGVALYLMAWLVVPDRQGNVVGLKLMHKLNAKFDARKGASVVPTHPTQSDPTQSDPTVTEPPAA